LLADNLRSRIDYQSDNTVRAPKQAQFPEIILKSDWLWEGQTMRCFIVAGAFGAAFGLLSIGIDQVGGQTIPKSLQEGGPEETIKQRENNWTVGRR